MWSISGNQKGQGPQDQEQGLYGEAAAAAPAADTVSLSFWKTGRLVFRETSQDSIFKTTPEATDV